MQRRQRRLVAQFFSSSHWWSFPVLGTHELNWQSKTQQNAWSIQAVLASTNVFCTQSGTSSCRSASVRASARSGGKGGRSGRSGTCFSFCRVSSGEACCSATLCFGTRPPPPSFQLIPLHTCRSKMFRTSWRIGIWAFLGTTTVFFTGGSVTSTAEGTTGTAGLGTVTVSSKGFTMCLRHTHTCGSNCCTQLIVLGVTPKSFAAMDISRHSFQFLRAMHERKHQHTQRKPWGIPTSDITLGGNDMCPPHHLGECPQKFRQEERLFLRPCYCHSSHPAWPRLIQRKNIRAIMIPECKLPLTELAVWKHKPPWLVPSKHLQHFQGHVFPDQSRPRTYDLYYI